MVKRISIIFTPIFLFLIILLLVNCSNNKNIDDIYYTILENKSYVMKENRDITFTIYSKKDESLIKYKEENTYLLSLNELNYTLTDVNIDIYDLGLFYMYKITAPLPILPNTTKSDLILNISNPKFNLSLNFGTISLLNPKDYELLSVDSLYASYSLVSGIKQLVGINITLTNEYKYLSNLSLGEYSYGYLSKVIYDQKYDNEIDIYDIIPNYNHKYIDKNHLIGLKSKTLFIPITSENNYLIKEGYLLFKLDNKDYYLDTFSFMIGDVDIIKYPDLAVEGVINYV